MQFRRLQSIEQARAPKRALVIYGPRRVGKTTMLMAYLDRLRDNEPKKRIFFATGDDFTIRDLFARAVRKEILDFAAPYDVVAIDEAQSITQIGLGVKMIIDAFPEKTILLTGSSSFKLASELGAPLTGRHFVLTLLPLAQAELLASNMERRAALEDMLIYGSYPEVLLATNAASKQRILTELVSSYLYKDALVEGNIRAAASLHDVVKCLAFQVGQEVSLNEIARTVQRDTKTVGRYLDLLERMFIIRRVRGFSRNLRNEISKKAKYYFCDNGVRNAAIGQFNAVSMRNDVGALWENFIAMELMKASTIAGRYDQYYFWRTHAGDEVDMVREADGQLTGIECKWKPQHATPPARWVAAYPDARFMTMHRENYLDYLVSV